MISKIDTGIGWLKVTKFPGAIGIDIAKQIDHAIQELTGCERTREGDWHSYGS
ncbi:MAG: hypothetical protein NTW28_00315 [Candidatus Solibacter sp.]|nr:hypothetical protein [Candidatus Solibacter sp.]